MHLETSRQAQKLQGATDRGSAATQTASARRFELPTDPASTDLLRDSWISLLAEFHWDLYGTLTFREDTHPESAYKRFRLFISMINRKLYGPRWFKHNQGVSYCVALERQRRGVVHFHCLLADPELVRLLKGGWFKQGGRWANEMMEAWNELAGFARIEPVKVAELVNRYVSKYVVKGGEIDLGGPLIQRRLEQAPVQPDATTSQRRGRGRQDNSVSVPGLPGAGMSERLTRETSSNGKPLTFHPYRPLCASSDLSKLAASTKRTNTPSARAEQKVLDAVTTPEERAKLLARFSTATRRETSDLLEAVRVRVLALRAGYRESVA